MSATPDEIAILVQQHFDALPTKRKPVIRTNGLREWVPLAGIVAEGKDNKLQCISLATGMKCLPASKIPQAQGNVLHDWHAEVLAIRAFNRFVLDECKAVLQGQSSEFLRLQTTDALTSATEREWHDRPFTWNQEYKLHMYCSEAPCGDASMELIMAEQKDATPWDIPPSTTSDTTPTPATPTLPGRAYFSHLGIVRRKPSRPDAPSTLSKSCTDKLSLKQCTSLLSSLTALLVNPQHVYIATLILPSSRYSETACQRAFSTEGRMRHIREENESSGYEFRPFVVKTTMREFAYSQRTASPANQNDNTTEGTRQNTASTSVKAAPSNLAVAWTCSGHEESTLGGTLQGRKQFDPRGASFASRRKMWEVAAEVASSLVEQLEEREDGKGNNGEVHHLIQIQRTLQAQTYDQVKNSSLLDARRRVKEEARREALQGWTRNIGDETFQLLI